MLPPITTTDAYTLYLFAREAGKAAYGNGGGEHGALELMVRASILTEVDAALRGISIRKDLAMREALDTIRNANDVYMRERKELAEHFGKQLAELRRASTQQGEKL